jgi:hypothetical protein
LSVDARHSVSRRKQLLPIGEGRGTGGLARFPAGAPHSSQVTSSYAGLGAPASAVSASEIIRATISAAGSTSWMPSALWPAVGMTSCTFPAWIAVFKTSRRRRESRRAGPSWACSSSRVALIAAGAAIVASIGAQIIGAIVSHKQEKRRLDLEECKLFADTRRVAFVSYLQTRNGFADDIWELYVKSDEFHSRLDGPQIRERADAHLSQLEPLKNEISLLAPDVARRFEVESRSELDMALAGLVSEDELISDRAAIVRWLAKFNSTTSENREGDARVSRD